MEEKWYDNTFSQALIIAGLGFTLLLASKTGRLIDLLCIPYGMLIGIWARGK